MAGMGQYFLTGVLLIFGVGWIFVCVKVFCASRGILHSKTNPLNARVSVYLCDNWEFPLYISSTSIWRGFPWWELWSMRGLGIFFTKSWQSIFLQAELASWLIVARTRGILLVHLRKAFLSDKRGVHEENVSPPPFPLNNLEDAVLLTSVGTISRSGSTKRENRSQPAENTE